MIAAGSFASIRSTDHVCGTISEYTLASRTRRAISWAYCAPKSTTRTGCCAVSRCVVLLICCLRCCDVLGHRLFEVGEFVVHPSGDEVFDDEGEERHDAAEGDMDEAAERPAHEAPEPEVAEQVDDVEPAVGDEDARAQVDGMHGAVRHEGQEPALPAEFDLAVHGRVLEEHFEHEQEQERSGHIRGDAVELDCSPNRGKV